jgi:amino acid transporter
VQTGALMTGLTSAAKFAALTVIALAAVLLGSRGDASAAHLVFGGAPVQPGLFGLAFISVLWAYDGFADLSFLAGEVQDPERTLPRAIIGGTLAIVAIYLATNAAYLYVLPIDRIAKSPLIAADTMAALIGRAGASFVSIVVAISTFGAVNSDLLGAPRLFYAAAEDGLFFQTLGRVHPTYRTPYISILFSALLGIVFVVTGTFEQIADTFVLAIWPFYGLAVAGLYRLRRRTDLARPYRVPGYPVVPAIFIAACVYLVASALVGDPLWTCVTLGVVLAGIPVYYFTFGRRVRSAMK